MPVRILVRQGDITDYDGDAIVNAANNHLILGAGVAGAIRRRGGTIIQDECDRHGPIGVGEAAITGAGALNVRWVIHAAAMGDEPVSEASIRGSVEASLRLAREQDALRVAFPVLGSGVGGFDFTAAAAIMLEVIRTSSDAEALQEIVLYGYLPDQAERLERLLG